MRALLAFFRIVLVVLAAAAPAVAEAHDYADPAALDELFAQLKTAPNADEANDIVQQIWSYWLNPDVRDLASRMDAAAAVMRSGDFDQGLTLLTGVVTDYPDYAEGWNQRATLNYLRGDYDAALADIAKALAIEPRHFGALSGRVMIYLKQGKRAEARRDMVAALAIDPFLGEKALFPELAPNVTHV